MLIIVTIKKKPAKSFIFSSSHRLSFKYYSYFNETRSQTMNLNISFWNSENWKADNIIYCTRSAPLIWCLASTRQSRLIILSNDIIHVIPYYIDLSSHKTGLDIYTPPCAVPNGQEQKCTSGSSCKPGLGISRVE